VTVCFLIQMHSSRREKRPTPKVCSAEAGVLSSPGQSRLPASDTQRGAEASACGGQIHHDIIPDPGRRLNFEICRACQHFLLEPLARTRQEFSYTLGDDDAPPDGSVCSLYVLCLNSPATPVRAQGRVRRASEFLHPPPRGSRQPMAARLCWSCYRHFYRPEPAKLTSHYPIAFYWVSKFMRQSRESVGRSTQMFNYSNTSFFYASHVRSIVIGKRMGQIGPAGRNRRTDLQ
jgi:hypothetical protein